jgi:hypothetical protein
MSKYEAPSMHFFGGRPGGLGEMPLRLAEPAGLNLLAKLSLHLLKRFIRYLE